MAVTLTSLESALSADWQKAVAWLQGEEQNVASFLSQVASGAEVAIEDIESAAAYVIAHLSVVQTVITAVETAATVIAPGNATVAKAVSDLNTLASDTAAVAQGVVAGVAAPGSPTIVQDTLTAINSVQTLAGLANQASASLSQLAAASTTATAVVTPPVTTPAPTTPPAS